MAREPAAQDDQSDIQKIQRTRQRLSNQASGARHRVEYQRIVGRGPSFQHLGTDAECALNTFASRHNSKATSSATLADRPVCPHNRVEYLASKARGSAMEAAVQHNGSANPGPYANEQKRRAWSAKRKLRQGVAIDVVIDRDGDAQSLLEKSGQRHILPAIQDHRRTHPTGISIDESRKAEAYGLYRVAGCRRPVDQGKQRLNEQGRTAGTAICDATRP
jgi:hypothetical protein